MNNSVLDRIMQLGANWAGGDQAWVPWWTASLIPVSSVSLQAMNITSRSRSRLTAGRHFQGHTGSAVSRSVSCEVGLTRDGMTVSQLQQKTSAVVWGAEGTGFAQPGEEKTTEGPDICLQLPKSVLHTR